MRLAKLELENIKKLNIVQEFPEDVKSVDVSGQNGAGKSTFIDSIWNCLTGKDIADEPIQNKKNKGHIEVTLKDKVGNEEITYIARLEFKKEADGKIDKKLTVRVNDELNKGNKKALELLQSKVGSLYFDVFEFVNMEPRHQKAELEKILNLDLSGLEKRKVGLDEDKLTLENKRKAIEDQINQLEFPDDGVIYEKKDAANLIEKIQSAQKVETEKNQLLFSIQEEENSIEFIKNRNSDLQAAIEDMLKKIEEHKASIANNDLSIKEKETSIEETKKAVEAIVVPDVSKIQEELADIETNNNNFVVQERFNELVDLKKEIDESIGVTVKKLDALKKERIDEIAKATKNFPVKGIDFDEDGLTYKGLPLNESQMSTGQIMKIGVEIAISKDPKLKLVRIPDASLLDPKNLAAVQQVVEEYGFIPFYEKVADGDIKIQFNQTVAAAKELVAA